MRLVGTVINLFSDDARWLLFYARVLCKTQHVKRYIDQYPYDNE